MIPQLLICEGREDKFFFEHLIDVRKLQRFHIRDAGGNSRFADAISKFQIQQNKAYRGIKDILIVADNDDAPDARFANVCDQINDKFGAGAAPDAPLKATTGAPKCTVLMVPWVDTKGSLESLCVDAARNADPHVGAHVDYFLALLAADRWSSPVRHGKAWLRSNLAGRCSVDPFIPLGKVFNDKRHQNIIPVGHVSFDLIANVLNGIGKAK